MSNVLQLLQASKIFARSPILDTSALTTETDSAVPIATWMGWLNDSQTYHFNKVVLAAQEYFSAQKTITWTVDQETYDMPGDSVRIRFMERTDTDPDRVILPITLGDKLNFQATYPDYSYIYGSRFSYIWGNVIGFRPIPSEAGTVNVLYIRRLPDLMYGTASSATSTTIVFPSSPDLGDVSNEDDYYNNAKVKIISATTGAGQSKLISDYVGSTRTATVAEWDTTPTGTIVYNIECEIPIQYHSAVAIYTAIISKVVDEDEAANLKHLHSEWEADMVAGLIPRQSQGPRMVHYVED